MDYKVTILDPDFYDIKKCCSKIVSVCKNELVQGSIATKDFKVLQEKHIKSWHQNSYTFKYPVMNLGLQVVFL